MKKTTNYVGSEVEYRKAINNFSIWTLLAVDVVILGIFVLANILF